MRLNLATSWLSFDVWLFEQPDDEDEDDPAPRLVAGAGSADLTQADTFNPLEQVDELPGERHRGFGVTG